MAEGAIIEVVEEVIGKLGNVAFQEIGLLSCVKDEFEKIRNTCSAIHAMVQDVEERQAQHDFIKVWLRDLKDVLRKADNLLDRFSAEVTRREVMTQNKMKKVRVFFSKFNQLAYDLKKIKAIRKRLDDIGRARSQFHLDERLDDRKTYSSVCSEDVIGRENDKKAIIGRLLDPNVEENVSVLPIVAMGGIGKTTLAQFVYNDEEITKHFEMRIWVWVSDDFDVIKIVKEILECLGKKKTENLDINAMVNDFQEGIYGKKYLLVLDDMWNYDREKWLGLKDILLSGASGSRILVTTREEQVARSIKTIEPYFLEGLNLHESLILLDRYASKQGGEKQHSNLQEIGSQIVEKCRGNPLAICTMGSLLLSKTSERDWLQLNDHELSKLNQHGILLELKLSYDHLPSHLKQCFAYCSLFPKDCKIEKEKLIKLWMAQGFIKLSDEKQFLEDVGNEYFRELCSRSLFQEVEEDKWGNISFKIHGLMHDLLLLVAGNESTILGVHGEHIDEETRHLSFGFHLGSTFPNTHIFRTRNLRTFLLCGQQLGERQNGLNQSTCDPIVSHFKFLRVLDWHEIGIETVPSSISNLNHLRYLDLSGNRYLKMLPDSLSRLHYLQTLKLSGCVQLKELPRDISKLVNLRFLEIDGCRALTHMPCGLGQLTNLQTLSRFVMSKDTGSVSRHHGELKKLNRLNGELKELNRLKELRGTLEIVNLRHGKDAAAEYEAANLKEIGHLRALGLSWIEDEVDEEDVLFYETSLEALVPHSNLQVLSLYRYRGVNFPTCLSSLTNLVKFALFGCKKFQHLSSLDQFPNLKVLELHSLVALEYISNCEEFSNSSFLLSLEELKLKYCPNLKGWWRRRDSIKEVNDNDGNYIGNKLKYCPNLKGWWQRRDSIKEVNDNDGNYIGITTGTTSTTQNHLLPLFPCLSKLCIRGCPKLTSMPLFPYLEKLELYSCSFKPLEQTTRIAATTITTTVASTSSSSSSTIANSPIAPLSKLKSLEIGQMEEPLSEECLLSLISLDHLWIYECHGHLLQNMQHLTALKQLDICSSKVFDLSNDKNGMKWQSLGSLSSLWLFQLSKLESLPMGLQHVTSLRKLAIEYCPSLMEIPKWICRLTSLEIFEILQCPKLKSLPVEISQLTSLHTLKIRYCPILLQRCKTGDDWGRIAHIPNLYLGKVNSDGEPSEQ